MQFLQSTRLHINFLKIFKRLYGIAEGYFKAKMKPQTESLLDSEGSLNEYLNSEAIRSKVLFHTAQMIAKALTKHAMTCVLLSTH